MLDRLTDGARRVVVLAQEEARRLGHDHLGTEHLMLGLARRPDGVAATVLAQIPVSLDGLRQDVERMVGRGQGPSPSHLPFTPRLVAVIQGSAGLASQLGHGPVGTGHMLLSLIDEGGGVGVGAQMLVNAGADLPAMRESVRVLLAEG